MEAPRLGVESELTETGDANTATGISGPRLGATILHLLVSVVAVKWPSRPNQLQPAPMLTEAERCKRSQNSVAFLIQFGIRRWG